MILNGQFIQEVKDKSSLKLSNLWRPNYDFFFEIIYRVRKTEVIFLLSFFISKINRNIQLANIVENDFLVDQR
jgi:hypothetical protein